jgi:hypothetical protein
MDVESVSGTTTHCLQKSANLKTFLGLEVRFGKGTLLLYCFVNARRSCISSFMVISLFNFRRPSLSKGLFAGAMGGLAGGLVKAAAEVLYPACLGPDLSARHPHGARRRPAFFIPPTKDS